MGAWGDEPWDNDDAADWFAELISPKFVKQIDVALRKDPEDDYETVRAACYVLNVLGHNYIWPVDKLQPQLKLAVRALQQILEAGVLEDEKVVRMVRKEMKSLSDRLKLLQSVGDAGESAE